MICVSCDQKNSDGIVCLNCWNYYGSELCAGAMSAREEELEEQLKKAKSNRN